ncbi:hypothetical protein GCM10022214_01980 [Actinomadura miaoliensis]|uniref:Transposase n=1 Tax=Actinomadura miaoliensis TaxID=430685 RepID=A0ABP7UWR3_9ACTN
MVERCFNRLKQFRAIATRFDKPASRYRCGVLLASLIMWLRHHELSGAAQVSLRRDTPAVRGVPGGGCGGGLRAGCPGSPGCSSW